MSSHPIPDLTNQYAGRCRLIERIGRGASGSVYRAQDIYTKATFAVKCLYRSHPAHPPKQGRDLAERLAHEAHLQRLVHDHPHILTLHQSGVFDDIHYLLYPFCEGGSLSDVVATPYFWRRDDRVRGAMAQIVDAVAHCHARGVSHRDLKPQNVLVSADRRHYYLADFGHASQNVYSGTFGVGSRYYKSPECLCVGSAGLKYNTQISDIWSLGVMLLCMLTGSLPWTIAQTSDKNYRGYLRHRAEYLAFTMPLTMEGASLISRILEPNTADRITLQELRKELVGVERFMLTEEELMHASGYARNVYMERAREIGMLYRPPQLHSSPFRSFSIPAIPPLTFSPRNGTVSCSSLLITPSTHSGEPIHPAPTDLRIRPAKMGSRISRAMRRFGI
ncbi:kinase-like domain-containing protein [Amylostereum chailletii]|nr:kinase-like domain-containing protein [Amylostereum chailletii]